jgi:hypothetical protein
LPNCAALTVPLAKSLFMPAFLSGLGPACFGSGVRQCLQIDKSKFALFKPLSLDVIFHHCEIVAAV